tara:strand:+ start:60 stop:446 length:387 start_codon:yes stop_codon:yes gene_type:complete
MDPFTVALIAQGVKMGADMYGKHRQGQAQDRADRETEEAQRRADAIAMLKRQQAQRIPRRQAAMPKDARAASIMGQLAGLGSSLYGMRGAGGAPESQVSGLLDRGLIRRGAGGGGGLTYDSPYSMMSQ